MAISEKICWAVLKNAHGNSVTFGWAGPDGKPQGQPTENAIAIGKLKSELVLKFTKQEIEDTLYFLEHRGYLLIHSIGLGDPMMYSLTEKAIDVIGRDFFSEEEEEAFKEAVLELHKPGWLGLKFNAKEGWQRFVRWWANLDRR